MDKMNEIYEKLSAPFTIIGEDGKTYYTHKWRVLTGRTCVPYVDARQVSKRLNDVLGIDGWSHILEETTKNMMICNLTIMVDGKELSHSDVGTPNNVEKEKSMASDALKRAAVHFGVGAYLHDIQAVTIPKSENVDLRNGDAVTHYINKTSAEAMKLSEIYHKLKKEDKLKYKETFVELFNIVKNDVNAASK